MEKVKKNVSQFNSDVEKLGSYSYTTDRLSSNVANARISSEIASIYDFKDKVVLDLGCGDGSYTLEFSRLGIKKIIGVDPASEAISIANKKCGKYNLESIVNFHEGNIYDLDNVLSMYKFDCIVVRGVLHHLPNAEKAFEELKKFPGDIIILEPNGNNFILKLIEFFSSYHRAHEERSFSSSLLRKWIKNNKFTVKKYKFFNIVPFFCPDLFVKFLTFVEPVVEKISFMRFFFCGQVIFLIKNEQD